MKNSQMHPLAKPAPVEGSIVYVEGYEFIATDVTITDATDDFGPFQKCHFTGVCTDAARNDSIRGTSYNGGHYGWRIN